MKKHLLPCVLKAGTVGACMLSAAQWGTAAEVQISGQVDTYLESYTAGDKTVTRLSSGGAGGGSP